MTPTDSGHNPNRGRAAYENEPLRAEAWPDRTQAADSACAAYRPQRKRLDIGQAISAAKQGARIARKGWNSSQQYVYYIPAASYPAQTPSASDEFGPMVPYREYLALKTAQDDVATWAPSCSDTLANDWYIV